jgi:hypothetical protein
LISHQPLNAKLVCAAAAGTAGSARRAQAQLRDMDLLYDRSIRRTR